MDEPINRSQVASLRSDFRSRTVVPEERVQPSEELTTDSESGVESAPAPSRRRKQVDTANHFNGPSAPVQFKLPADLIASLKLHSISTNESMSDIVLRCLTSPELIEKAWISTRKAS